MTPDARKHLPIESGAAVSEQSVTRHSSPVTATGERALAIFLHGLLEPSRNGAAPAVGAVADPATLERLVAQPATALQTLLSAHADALLATWPGGAALRPAHLPAAVLQVGAALNNLAWAATHPSPRLLTITLRMVEALPAAEPRETVVAYHSLARHIEWLPTMRGDEWQPVVGALLRRSPLTAAWLPATDDATPWPLLLALLREPVLYAALRDRWLSLLPPPETLAQQGISLALAKANASLGRLLERVGEQGGEAGQHALLVFYEADCLLQRQGSGEERPTWPVLRWLHAARASSDSLMRRNGERVLWRYRPLWPLLAHEHLLRRYARLDGRFLEQLGTLLETSKRVRLRRVVST